MKRVVAWYSRGEWIGVYNDMFSTDPVSQRHGVDRVTVWKCRVLHRLSTAIECTTELVRAHLLDIQYAEDVTREPEVRLTVAMALIRFVNLITEKSQTEDYAQSVHYVAQQVGLPEWLVDLRHDATHSSLPSIHILRTALKTALNWIKMNYWEAQLLAEEEDEPLTQHIHSTPRPQPMDSDIAKEKAEKLIQQYINCHLRIYKQQGGDSPKPENKQCRAILDDVEKLVSTNREEVVRVCIQDGCLIHTTEQLAVMNVDAKALLISKDLSLPKELVTLWRPLLKLLQQKNMTDGLLQALSMALTEDCDLRNRLICGWIETIVTHAQDPENFKKNERIYKKCFEVNCRAIMETLVKKPSKYTQRALSSIFSVAACGLSKSQQSKLLECMQMYTQCNSQETWEDNVYTLEQLTGASVSDPSTNIYGQDQRAASETTWRLCTDILNWSLYPLGTCPGVVIDYNNLELQAGNHATAYSDSSCNEMTSDNGYPENTDLMDCEETSENTCPWTRQQILTIAERIKLF